MFKPTDTWLDTYVRESNKIDPQPGHANEPGDPHYDDHLKALKRSIASGNLASLASPLFIHGVLMGNLKGMEREAGNFRACNVTVGGRVCPHYLDVPRLFQEWQEDVNVKVIPGAREEVVWRIHVDYEHIHPFIDGNGRSGRLLMVNHAIICGLEPWIVEYKNVASYYARF